MRDQLTYLVVRMLYRILHLLPWWAIGIMARLGAMGLYAVVRYRRRLIEEHIRLCLPDLSAQEQRDTIWRFYHHLMLQFLSSPKVLYAPIDTIRARHIQVNNIEALSADMGDRPVAIILMGHIGNWEILSAGATYFADHGLKMEQLYRPLSNPIMDRLQLELRNRHGAISTPKGDIGRSLMTLMRQPKEEQERRAIIFIADQTPSPAYIGLWADFLHRPTPFLNGAERLARKFALPVYYADIYRDEDIRYRVELIPITSDGSTTAEGEVTMSFVRLLEATIRREPSLWLWSHKRWKHLWMLRTEPSHP